MKKNVKGFTVIEMICSIAILGILASMAVPSYINHLYLVQKKADIAAARSIYTVATAAMTNDTMYSEYGSTKDSQMCFHVSVATDDGTETYYVTPVARSNGIPYKLPNGTKNKSVTAPSHNKADYWPKISNAFPTLNQEISDAFGGKGPLMHFDTMNPDFKINCWYVVRKIDPSIVNPTRKTAKFVGTEIWVGESCLTGTGDNGLKFRIYPDPDIEYLTMGNFKGYKKDVADPINGKGNKNWN